MKQTFYFHFHEEQFTWKKYFHLNSLDNIINWTLNFMKQIISIHHCSSSCRLKVFRYWVFNWISIHFHMKTDFQHYVHIMIQLFHFNIDHHRLPYNLASRGSSTRLKGTGLKWEHSSLIWTCCEILVTGVSSVDFTGIYWSEESVVTCCYLASSENRTGTNIWALFSFFLCCSSSRIRVTLCHDTAPPSGPTSLLSWGFLIREKQLLLFPTHRKKLTILMNLTWFFPLWVKYEWMCLWFVDQKSFWSLVIRQLFQPRLYIRKNSFKFNLKSKHLLQAPEEMLSWVTVKEKLSLMTQMWLQEFIWVVWGWFETSVCETNTG